MTFNEAMNPALITPSQVYLRLHNTGTTVPGTVAFAYSAGNTIITITPVTPLADATIYDIYYYPNQWWLTDIAGNNATNTYGILATFTTGTAAAVNGACGTSNGLAFSSTCPQPISAPPVPPRQSPSRSPEEPTAGPGPATASTPVPTPPARPRSPEPRPAALPRNSPALVSLWPGNDTATDVGPGGNNGTLENGVTYALGEVGDAFSFAGGSADQYVKIGQPVPANLQIQSAITLSAWIYPTAMPTDNGSGAMALIAGSQDDGVFGGATIFFDGRVNPDGNPGNVPVQATSSSTSETDPTGPFRTPRPRFRSTSGP